MIEQLKEMRGTLTERGTNSPYRDRSIEENVALFTKMKDGGFPDGHCILRAKIDMSSPNVNLRDPTLYRIKRASHPITGHLNLV
jgi:glutaminyl-tRNA synthetase